MSTPQRTIAADPWAGAANGHPGDGHTSGDGRGAGDGRGTAADANAPTWRVARPVPAPVAEPETFSARPWARNAVLVGADLAALALALGGAALVAYMAFGVAPAPALTAAVVLALAAYTAAGLYAAIPRLPVEEVRALSLATSAAFATTAAAALGWEGGGAAVATLAAAWLGALLAVPLARATARTAFGARPWWGSPAVVLGAGPVARRAVRAIQRQPELGLRVVAMLDDDPAARGEAERELGVSAPGGLALAPGFAAHRGVRCAIVAACDGVALDAALEHHARLFRHLLVLPGLDAAPTLGVTARDVGGALGFEVRAGLLTPWRWAKRALDVAVALAAGTLLLPVLLVLAVVVRLDSPGPALFVQTRLGRGGRCFRLFKLRTMHVGAHRRLQEVLASDPAARAEYARHAKLANDPRVTRAGRWLRRLSLDELPQLANVLLGDMSLVGPRAYLPEELDRMGRLSRRITSVTPGITGLWQVSGRNALPFDERLDLDVRYVRNWTPSLDLYLLARTIPTVMFGRGAA